MRKVSLNATDGNPRGQEQTYLWGSGKRTLPATALSARDRCRPLKKVHRGPWVIPISLDNVSRRLYSAGVVAVVVKC